MSDQETRPDVTVVRWPQERQRLTELRAARIPRLVLHDAHTTAPAPADALEDWLRIPDELNQLPDRLAALKTNTTLQLPSPHIDEHGLLHVGDNFSILSPLEEQLARVLLDNVGSLVTQQTLIDTAWPSGTSNTQALRVHIARLRQKILPLRLEIHTARNRGYLMTTRIATPP